MIRAGFLLLYLASIGCNAAVVAPPAGPVAVVPPLATASAPALADAPPSPAATLPPAAPSSPMPGDPCASGGDATKKTDLTCADRKEWFAVLRWPASCEEAYDATAIHGSPAIEFHPIAPQRWIVKVDCTLGAYQGYAVYLLRDERVTPPTATLLQFPAYHAPRDRQLVRTVTTELWGQADFHDDTRELVVFNRYRGPGDCGALVTYALGSGRPRVKEFRSKNVCDGLGAEDPGRWPRIAPP